MPNAYYLKLGSGKEQVLGASRDRYHVGWIKLASFSMGDGKRQAAGAAAAAGQDKTPISELSVTKLTDRASTEIYLATSRGREFKSAVIEVADEKTGIPKLRLTLTDVMVDSFSMHGHGGLSGGQTEAFKLSFAAVQWNHNPVAEESVGDMLQTGFKALGLTRAH